MRTKTQSAILLLSAMIALTQISSCKKDTANVAALSTAGSNDNAVADTTTDSSLNNGLIAWYTFDGDVLDHSRHHNNVIFNSATPARGKSGHVKTAYSFDGTSNFMQIANKKSLSPLKITLYALVKPMEFYQGPCRGNRIISKGYNDYASGRIDLGSDDATYYNYSGCYEVVQNKYENFYGSYGDGTNATGAKDVSNYIKTGQWYSIVYTFDGVYSKLYLNGVLVNELAHSTTYNANTDPLYFGRNEDPGYPYYFNGIIDEIRIYRRVLKPKEVL